MESLDQRRLMIAAAFALGLAMSDAIILLLGIGSPNAVTRWLPYVGFFLSGVLLRNLPGTSRRVRLAASIVVIGIVATALGTAVMVGPLGFGLARGRYLYKFNSIATVPVSLAVFALLVWLGPGLSRRMSPPIRKLISSVAAASFGIYLLHPMVLTGLSILGLNAKITVAPVAVAATIGATFVITWAIIVVARRLPGVRAIV